jgi:hypothetical protein
MRQDILDYIETLSLGGFTLSQQLPYTDSTTPLYIKNPKSIYVDVTRYSTEPLVTTLDSLIINSETNIVRIFFSTDAKSLPANYDDLVSDLRAAKDIEAVPNSFRRLVDVKTYFESDLLVTELEIRFTKIT